MRSRNLAYFAAFDLVCLYVTPCGRVGIGRAPSRAGAHAAWWARRGDAARIFAAARKATKASDGLPAAAAILHSARKLGVEVTPHAVAMMRVEGALAKINTKLAAAQGVGALQFFNQEYQRRRRQAQAQGKGFMSCATARKRLERVLAGVVAGGISAVYVVRTFRTVGLAI
jgi:hypothetical protein